MQEVKEKNHENIRLHAPPEEGWQTFIERHCSIHGLMKRLDFRITSKFTVQPVLTFTVSGLALFHPWVDETFGFSDNFQIHGPTCLDFYSFRNYIAMVSAIEHELPTP